MQIGKNKNTWLNKGYLIPVYGAAKAGYDAVNKAKQKKSDIESDIAIRQKELESSLSNIPTYQIPEEAQQYLDLLNQTGEDLGKSKDIYNSAVDIARTQASMGDAPGASQARQDINQSTASQVQNIMEAGGGGVDALGAISQVGLNEQQALRDLAKTNTQYQAQAKQNLQGALMGQAGFESGLIQQQAALKGAGLQTMLGEKNKVFQSNLDKYLTMTDYELAQLGVSQSELEALRNRRAQIASSAITGVASLGSSFLSGGMGG